MSVREKGALLTWTTGDRNGPPVVLLHDRYLDHDSNDVLGRLLEPSRCVISVRSARTQMESGLTKGYYWYLGPLDQPELSTLGDALSHLERLLATLSDNGQRRLALVGTGEGGSVALLIALLWRELVSGVVSIDGPLARNIADMPLDFPPADGLPVLLAQRQRDLTGARDQLAGLGAQVTLGGEDDAQVVEWVARLPR